MVRLSLILILFNYLNVIQAENTSVSLRKSISANLTKQSIEIDGELNEDAWINASRGGDFIQTSPNPGNPSRQKSEVAILYTNQAIYIGAWLYEVAADSISQTLSQRDDNINADLFAVGFDTYNDDQNAFVFGVTAAGVQIDLKVSANGDDEAWNAAWQSSVKITDKGWFVEMKIPYSALRFTDNKEQNWGINFRRTIRRFREESFWSFTDPKIQGIVNQFGDLSNLYDIQSPLRLSLTPYSSVYYNRYDDNENNIHDDNYSFNVGTDLKYGINQAFTLDMTLIPDFGQVQSDNVVLNTSPFEVKYNEFRQFFTEGTEIYNKSGLFYSRRIGGTPLLYYDVNDELNQGEQLQSSPKSAKLINASKITGRTKSGTGFGFFNALTRSTYAVAKDSLGNERKILTDPLTNYNVFVFDQNLKNNSFINFTNTNVMRSGHYYDANVSAISSKLNTKNNKFGIALYGALSQQFEVTEKDKTQLGNSINVNGGKQSGNFTWNFSYSQESDKYDPNDLGFLYNNNSRELSAYAAYNVYEPTKHFMSKWSESWITFSRLYFPDAFMGFDIGGNAGGTFKNWITSGFWVNASPLKTRDYYETRVTNRYFLTPENYSLGLFFSTDYRKKIAVDIKTSSKIFNHNNWMEYSLLISPRFRFSDKLTTVLSCNYSIANNEIGSALDVYGSPTIINDTIIFATRSRTTYENIASINYIFTNKMALSFRLRHYWSKLEYNSFYNLSENGELNNTLYIGKDAVNNSLHNTSFNAFNIDLVYTWVFSPGSELRIVWKQIIYTFSQQTSINYFSDLNQTLKAAQQNSLSLKLLYFIDAGTLLKKKSHL